VILPGKQEFWITQIWFCGHVTENSTCNFWFLSFPRGRELLSTSLSIA
jgi:hypothetical protein